MGPSDPGRKRAGTRVPLATPVFVVLAAAAVAAFGVTHDAVSRNNRTLLDRRAGEVSAFLRTSIDTSASTLALLSVLATLPDRAGFEQGASTFAGSPGAAVVTLDAVGDGFVVSEVVGNQSLQGGTVGSDLASLATRALGERGLVADLVTGGGQIRLALAMAAPGPVRTVVLIEDPVDPARPIPRTPGSPFSEMSGALYASPAPDPARLVLTSEGAPLTGSVIRLPFPVGPDQWTLVVGARSSLAGTFPARAPWIILGTGLLAALLASAVVRTLARRRVFADALVDERTEELEHTRSFLERVLVSGPAVVVRAELSDPERRISYVSPNVERVLGVNRGDVLRHGTLVPYFHPDDLEQAEVSNARLREGGAATIEFRIRADDGSERWVSALSVPETDEQRVTTGVFAYLTDVSERRAAEAALRAAQQVAEASSHSKSEFLSRMSHELRTPLNAVLGFSQLLQMHALPEDQSEAVDQIIRGGRHLLDLIDDVLDISRIEAGRLLLSPEPVLVSDVVQESVDLVRSFAEQKQVALGPEKDGMDVYVLADHRRTKQVLLNLLSNAVKYNRPGGSVVISCSQAGPAAWRISVADTGPGVPADQMDRLFAPFDRLDAGRTEIEGTGIGLALSKNLTEAMGGVVSVESIVGTGSTFSVDLPRCEGPVERYQRLQARVPPVAQRPAPHASGLRRHTVLYIEDNPSNLRLIERILAHREQVEVVSAMDGESGIGLAEECKPTLILLDLHLPGIGGEEVLYRLRNDPLTSSIPVVMVTADATAGQVQRLLAAGATAYVTKPIDVAELLGIVDDVLVAG